MKNQVKDKTLTKLLKCKSLLHELIIAYNTRLTMGQEVSSRCNDVVDELECKEKLDIQMVRISPPKEKLIPIGELLALKDGSLAKFFVGVVSDNGDLGRCYTCITKQVGEHTWYVATPYFK